MTWPLRSRAWIQTRVFGPEARPSTASYSTLIAFREEDPKAQILLTASKYILPAPHPAAAGPALASALTPGPHDLGCSRLPTDTRWEGRSSRWCWVTLPGAPSSPFPTARSRQGASTDARVPGLTSSVSYMVLLEEKGEGSGSRSSHGLSTDSSRSSPFSGATSHCALLLWGFRVTTTLPGHGPVTGLQGPPAPGPKWPPNAFSSEALPSCPFQSPAYWGKKCLRPGLLGSRALETRRQGTGGFSPSSKVPGEDRGGVGVVTAALPHFFPTARWSPSSAVETCTLSCAHGLIKSPLCPLLRAGEA